MLNVTHNSVSKWMEGDGPEADVVISSRIRLARNLDGVPFPHRMGDGDAQRVLGAAEKATAVLNNDPALRPVSFVRLAELPPLDRQVLVEKHLISPQHAKSPDHGALILRGDESVSVMVNEEDHLRIQVLYPGLRLEEAWELASRVDDILEAQVPYAFGDTLGYLTACPTNVGTGMRASVMMHLPALVMTNQIGKVFNAIIKLGIAVRGLYGEGTEATGNIFQISNQITLGRSEEEIIANLRSIAKQIIERERGVREALLREKREEIEDRVCRAYGILTHARVMNSTEAMQLLSEVRMGNDLRIVAPLDPKALNELLVLTRPAYLQRLAGRELGPYERDVCRAALIRERLRKPDGPTGVK